ncbi:isopentenyl-diphosphate Delta-isomerase [Flavihumibacter solisilvae]|uniref:Isopentenyl-diphosphate delta-isomerase n=1 Tax=Flavihumibacter solisilvae TaxID=1349421 RepID=A0A0C1L513_9BACT|nr:isopentenyl-diphosphate Delta-isomerase [Flavihumibacter solisilvae]KIC94641.1 isopentenyl-diphosphate delta-isomerase [Flavihumibacter solisilvae]
METSSPFVVLVDDSDAVTGIMEKMEAHRKGLLHRAFSVFIFNAKGDMLLQQRATNKYHSAGLWTNACCSHPAPDEPVEDAAGRRLQEEMGFTTPLVKAFSFIYKTEFDNGLTEHEFDHVLIGEYGGSVTPAPSEVKDYCFLGIEEIEKAILSHPQRFTTWFHVAFPRVVEWRKSQHAEQPHVD